MLDVLALKNLFVLGLKMAREGRSLKVKKKSRQGR
jgi:hypothetical protein